MGVGRHVGALEHDGTEVGVGRLQLLGSGDHLRTHLVKIHVVSPGVKNHVAELLTLLHALDSNGNTVRAHRSQVLVGETGTVRGKYTDALVVRQHVVYQWDLDQARRVHRYIDRRIQRLLEQCEETAGAGDGAYALALQLARDLANLLAEAVVRPM